MSHFYGSLFHFSDTIKHDYTKIYSFFNKSIIGFVFT